MSIINGNGGYKHEFYGQSDMQVVGRQSQAYCNDMVLWIKNLSEITFHRGGGELDVFGQPPVLSKEGAMDLSPLDDNMQ